MIEKKVRKKKLEDATDNSDLLDFWLSKSPQERVAAVDYLRRQHNGSSARLQRIARVFKRKPR
jgi:hypothetical protein